MHRYCEDFIKSLVHDSHVVYDQREREQVVYRSSPPLDEWRKRKITIEQEENSFLWIFQRETSNFIL
jgi:hypothetical protein